MLCNLQVQVEVRTLRSLSPIGRHASRRTVTVRRTGEIKWRATSLFLSEVLADEPVGLVEQPDGTWEVYFGPMSLGFVSTQGDSFIPRETPLWTAETHPQPVNNL